MDQVKLETLITKYLAKLGAFSHHPLAIQVATEVAREAYQMGVDDSKGETK